MLKTRIGLPRLFFCMSCLLCLNTFTPAAIVIDDFTTPQTLTWDTGVVTGDGILGGERDVTSYQQSASVHINAAYGSGCHIINASIDYSRGYAYFTYDGQDGSTSNYDKSGLGHVDLTGGGQYNGFLITFSQVDTTGGYFSILLCQGNDQYGQIHVDLPTQPQSLFLPFADFDMNVPAAEPPDPVPADTFIDFSDVGYINIAVSLDSGGSCTIDSIMVTTPEPATLTLLALGGLLILKKQKHKF